MLGACGAAASPLSFGIERRVLAADEAAGDQLVPPLEAARLLHERRLHLDLVPLAQVAEPDDALPVVAGLRRIVRRPRRLAHDGRDEPERVDDGVPPRRTVGPRVGHRDGHHLGRAAVHIDLRVRSGDGRRVLAPARAERRRTREREGDRNRRGERDGSADAHAPRGTTGRRTSQHPRAGREP